MTFSLAPFAFALLQAVSMHARVFARDGLNLRPGFVSKAVLARLKVGVRALEAYLRRVLILMALEMEHDLVAMEKPENLKRAKAKMVRLKKYVFVIYPTDPNKRQADSTRQFFDHGAHVIKPQWNRDEAIWDRAKVPIGDWLDRLDYLHAIAKDPIKKARRLAFTLARSRHGILMAPHARPGILRRWGFEASAIHDAMAHQIMEKSRTRPPPLPPPRRGPKPMITVFW